MTKKSVEDYLMEGIHGVRRPLEAERQKFLGTLRERIVLALTTDQVITDRGLTHLEKAMKKHPDARLLINGKISYKYLMQERALANQYNIPYTIITNQDVETDIGLVLTYDHAINKKKIFIPDEDLQQKSEVKQSHRKKRSLLARIRHLFK